MDKENFQTISRNDFMVTINGEKVLTPEFTRIATSRYRLTPDFTLQKQCPKCKKWYVVAKYENAKWIEIWKEEEYKQSKTGGFPTYCTLCSNELKVISNKHNKDGNSANATNKTSNMKKDTVIWDEEVYKYVMIQAVLQNKSKNNYINNIFREIMKKNPLLLSIDSKI